MVRSSARIGEKGTALTIAKAIIRERLAAVPEAIGAGASCAARDVAEACTQRNLDIIHENSRSRTEVIFLTAVALASLEADPPGAIFGRSSAGTERHVTGVSDDYERGAASPRTGPNEHDAIEEIVSAVASPRRIGEFRESALRELVVQCLAPGSKLHVMLHPRVSLARGLVPADAFVLGS